MFPRCWAPYAHTDSAVSTKNATVTFPALPPPITCKLFTANIKYVLYSCKIHCTEVSWNLLSLLLWNKTKLTSVTFGVK